MPQVKQLKDLKAAGPAAKEDFPFFVQWHLTERCNLRCRHCYQEAAPPARGELGLDEVKTVISEIGETLEGWAEAYEIRFSPSFNITGGEPLLRNDLFRIIDECCAGGFDIFLLTNGTLIDRETAGLLSECGVKAVQVSIEGPKEIHDRIRGAGNFRKAMAGVRNLVQAGHTVTLNATLSRENARSMAGLAEAALDSGAQRLGFSRLVPCGTGRSMRDALLSADEVRSLYEDLLSVSISGLEIVTGDPLALQMGQAFPSVGAGPRQSGWPAPSGCAPSGGCAAGVSGITILADGTLTPCRRLPVPIGNILEDSFREIWSESEVLNLLRDKSSYSGNCGRCARWQTCRGCRAIAFASCPEEGFSVSSRFLADDPQCFCYQPE